MLGPAYIDLLTRLAEVRAGQVTRVLREGGQTTFNESSRVAGTSLFSGPDEVEEALSAERAPRGKRVKVQ